MMSATKTENVATHKMSFVVFHQRTEVIIDTQTDAQLRETTFSRNVFKENYPRNNEEKVFSIGTDLVATANQVSAVTTNSVQHKTTLITFPGSLTLLLSLLLCLSQFVHPVLGLSEIATIAGNGETGYAAAGGPATSTSLNYPRAIWGDSMANSIYISVHGHHVIRKVDFESNIMTTVVGSGAAGGSGNGPATSATLNSPRGIWGNGINTYYIADLSNCVIRAVTEGVITKVAGSTIGGPTSGGDNGPVTSARIQLPTGIWVSPDNVLYISDLGHGIRSVDLSVVSDKLIRLIVVTEGLDWQQVWGNAVHQLFAAVSTNHVVKRVQSDGSAVTTYAGTGNANSNLLPGQATSTDLSGPYGVTGDIEGVSYVSEHSYHTVRVIDGSGYMTVVVGTGLPGTPTATNGDGGPPTSATLLNPVYLFCDTNSFIYIADSNHHKIRKLYDPSPTSQPTAQPSQPTSQPSGAPTEQPTCQPMCLPTTTPSVQPSGQPTSQPSAIPSMEPSRSPSSQPSSQPSSVPSMEPSSSPSSQPSSQPSGAPSVQPSGQPTSQPSAIPSMEPSRSPSSQPSSQPSSVPSMEPSSNPSSPPSRQLSSVPSVQPSSNPIRQPSRQPSGAPSVQPSSNPSSQPASRPSGAPSVQPSGQPSSKPSAIPSVQPSSNPNSQPSSKPSAIPSVQPSSNPSSQPSSQPSGVPSMQPISKPSNQPSSQLSGALSASPSLYLSCRPTITHSLSVLYSTITTVKFKTVLPYLYTSAVTGYGLSDVTVSRPLNGSGYVLLGASQVGLHRDITTAELQTIGAAVSYDFSGRSAANAGDVNGDGYDDLIIGVPYASRVYVLFGSNEGFVAMTEGFTVFGAKSSDLTGWSVSSAGDVNNDTYADVVIGVPMAFNTGAVYVLYGSTASHSDVYLHEIGADNGFMVRGSASQDAFGLSVSGVNDVNGDGYDDIIVSALKQSRFSAGALCIIFGNVTRTMDLALIALKPSEGRVYSGVSWSWLGYSASGAGDVNGDHYSDVIVGSAPRRNVVGTPVSCLLFGNNSLPLSGTLVDVVQKSGVTITGGGVVVAGLGDVNGDHFDDVMIASDVDLSTGGGIVVQLSVTLGPGSDAPTHSPTVLSSSLPTYEPSGSPTVYPTRPTALPTVAPSGPTHIPTVTPTQPTSLPSALPTAPSRQPTVKPTTLPSMSPTTSLTMMPSVKPSVRPTVAPTTVATLPPNTRLPTAGSTATPVLEPTRYPVYRPSPSPTVLTGLDTTFPGYTRVIISDNGTYNSNSTHTQFIVNATATVNIMGAGKQRVFTILPMSQSVTRIEAFNKSSDILDLSSFYYCHSRSDLNITIASVSNSNQRRFLRVNTANFDVSVSIHFPRSQVIELRGTTVDDLRNAQILFSGDTIQSVPTVKEEQNKGSNVIPLAVAISVLALFVLYTAYNTCSYYYSSVICVKEASVTSLTVDRERKQNRTFVTYIDTGDDWLDSFQSSSSDSSENSSNHNNQNSSNDNSSGVSSVVVSSEESSSVAVSPLLLSEEEYEEKSDEGGSHNGATNGHHFQFQRHTSTVVGLSDGDSHYNNNISSEYVKMNQSDLHNKDSISSSEAESDGKSSNGSDSSSCSYMSLAESYCLGE